MATATNSTETCDVTILRRLLRPEEGDMPLAAARYLLKLKLQQSDLDRMNELSQKARDGKLTAAEDAELSEYSRVGHLLAALQLKARKSLKNHGHSA